MCDASALRSRFVAQNVSAHPGDASGFARSDAATFESSLPAGGALCSPVEGSEKSRSHEKGSMLLSPECLTSICPGTLVNG